MMASITQDEFTDPQVQTDLFMALADLKKKHRDLHRDHHELQTGKIASHAWEIERSKEESELIFEALKAAEYRNLANIKATFNLISDAK